MASMRKLAFFLAVSALASGQAFAQGHLRVMSAEGCGCCKEWVKALEAEGYTAKIDYLPADTLMKRKLAAGLKPEQTSCHMAIIQGYVIEGHVPSKEIARLLREQPDAIGLAVPGMPIGSPGMAGLGKNDPYQVLLIKRDGATEVFASYPK